MVISHHDDKAEPLFPKDQLQEENSWEDSAFPFPIYAATWEHLVVVWHPCLGAMGERMLDKI